MKALLTIIITILTPWTLEAQQIGGDWNGLLRVQGMELRLVFHINESERGYAATLDSPDQGATGIPVSSTDFNNSKLTMQMAALGAEYEGILVENGSFEGAFSQAGQRFPLILTREVPEKKVLNRPQEPEAPLPYKAEEVQFNNEDLVFSGTLTLPDHKGPVPGVILVSGSGPQNRDEEFMTHKPFLVISDYLTRNGIAVLRYDDRGTGASTGSFAGSNSADFAKDALAAISYLKTRDEINADYVGVIGHSEGGLIAPMMAVESTDIKFIVLMAGPGANGKQILLDQKEKIGKTAGINEQELKFQITTASDAFDIVINSSESDDLKSELNSYLTAAYNSPLVQLPDSIDKSDLVNLEIAQLTSPWMRYFLKHEPSVYLSKVTCPVLAINGSKDVQVLSYNLELIEDALSAGGNQDYTVREYQNLNHLFQECKTGAIEEYATIEQTIAPVVLEELSDWIGSRVGSK